MSSVRDEPAKSDPRPGAAAAPGGASQPPAAPEAEANPLASIRSRLQLPEDQALDPERMARTLDLLMEFAIRLDQAVWKVWQDMAPESRFRTAGLLSRAMNGYLSGDERFNADVLARDLRLLSAMTASIARAASRVGRALSADFFARFAPEKIEDSVRAEGIPLMPMPNKMSVLCWKKYLRLSETLDQAAMEGEVRTLLAGLVEKVMEMRGGDVPAGAQGAPPGGAGAPPGAASGTSGAAGGSESGSDPGKKPPAKAPAPGPQVKRPGDSPRREPKPGAPSGSA